MWTISPPVHGLGLKPQASTARALSQTQDGIRIVRFDGVDELALVKSNREDDFLESAFARQLPKNFLSNVISKMAIGAKAVDKEAHRNITRSATRHAEVQKTALHQFRVPGFELTPNSSIRSSVFSGNRPHNSQLKISPSPPFDSAQRMLCQRGVRVLRRNSPFNKGKL
jgi:hypothetical protein